MLVNMICFVGEGDHKKLIALSQLKHKSGSSGSRIG